MDETVRGIIAMMRAAAPPGLKYVDEVTARRLRGFTRLLITASPGAAAEHARFRATAGRGVDLPAADLAARLRGAAILVTGGTGCVGSALMALLAAYGPRRLVSVSRGITSGGPRLDDAEYLHADIRDSGSLGRLVAGVAPDVIFHLAAQRDPGLAEAEVHRTVSTNVLGTRNVVSAALSAGVPQVVHASTGKALRPYSPDVYTASKRAAEWVMASSPGLLRSAARFTHVVDNSIVYRRLRAWAGAEAGTIRLHSPGIAFYAQSALESAQLLLLALTRAERGEFRVLAITDLGWPVSLLDLALAVVAEHGSRAAVYFSGYDAGYEEVPFPGLYDPATAGDVSPLMNAFEAAAALPGVAGAAADAFPLEFAPDPRLGKLVSALEACCERTRDPAPLRGALSELSWSLLDATLRAAPAPALARSAALARAHWDTLGSDHRRITETLCDLAGVRDGRDP
jgi:nucleoside-diphosphate-sugar epimerase